MTGSVPVSKMQSLNSNRSRVPVFLKQLAYEIVVVLNLTASPHALPLRFFSHISAAPGTWLRDGWESPLTMPFNKAPGGVNEVDLVIA